MAKSTNRARLTAEAITAEMRIPIHRIIHRTDGLNNSVEVTLLDADPGTQRRAAAICQQYQVIIEDPHQPGGLIDNRHDDLPQVSTVSLRNNLSDTLCATIARYIKEHTHHQAVDIHRVWEYFDGRVSDFWLHQQRRKGRAAA